MKPPGNSSNPLPESIPADSGPSTAAGWGQAAPARPVSPAAPIRRQPRFTHAGGERPLEGYTIKRGIGVGGFGEVYFAISDAGKEVALKRIQRNLDIELRGVRQCLNLKHVNLIALWDIRTSGEGDSWVVMEYVPGYSLRDLLQQHSRGLLESDVRHWFLSICAGVCYLHDRGIVHRDLKPGNIFYDSDAKLVKIGDYGLSKFISHSRGSGHTESVGTFHYMAPEIGRGVYGKGIDIYALGVILFELLTGELPFDGESSHEIIMKHLTASPPVERVPVPFRTVIENSLAKDPESRYANVREMLADLPWEEARSHASSTPSPMTHLPVAPGSEHPTRHFPEIEIVSVAGGCQEVDGILYIGDESPAVPAGPDRWSGAFDLRRTGRPLPVQGGPRDGTGGVVAGSPGPRHISNEPLARAVRTGTMGLWHWFQAAPLATPVKVVLAIGAGIVLVINSAWLFPAAVVLGLLYLVYFAIRSWMVNEGPAPVTTEERQRHSARQLEAGLRSSLNNKPLSDRIIELMGSLLIACLAAVVVGLLILAAGGGWQSPAVETWARYAWLASTATFASWGILIAGKTWDHRVGDDWQRRLAMAGIGLATGAVSWLLDDFLMLTATGLPGDLDLVSADQAVPLQRLAGNLAVFSAWFGLLRWWRLADGLRATRVSLWRTGFCIVTAVILSSTMGLDPVRAAMLALVTATAVQIAAPWIPLDERSLSRTDPVRA